MKIPYIKDIADNEKTATNIADNLNSRYRRLSGDLYAYVLKDTRDDRYFIITDVKNKKV